MFSPKVFVAEFIGTFALVFVGAAAGLYNVGLLGIALASIRNTRALAAFVIAAAPKTYSGVTATGTREFCIDQTGVLGAKTAAGTTVATDCTGFSPVGN